MTIYKINIELNSGVIGGFSRNCKIYEESSGKECDDIIVENPEKYKLFHNDCFYFTDKNRDLSNINIIVEKSVIRTTKYIAGVLILKGNKTYGTVPDKNINKNKNIKYSKKSKHYYKCIPDDNKIPSFLIPYEITNIGFQKIFQNKYVVFKYDCWEKTDNHPIGKIIHTIGDINILSNFYEYELYCKNLVKGYGKLNEELKKIENENEKPENENEKSDILEEICKKYQIEDRTTTTNTTTNTNTNTNINYNIFTVDPDKCTDFDDAFSINKYVDENNNKKAIISIYISNVSIILDYLNLWDSLSERISTIYMPDKRIPMLPPYLSEGICSLKKNTKHIVFTMDITISLDLLEIENIEYKNCLIQINENYVYETPELFDASDYINLYHITSLFHKNNKENKQNNQNKENIQIHFEEIKDSHDLVAYWMTFMNYECAKQLCSHQVGIYRRDVKTETKTETITETETEPTMFIEQNIQKKIKMYCQKNYGEYCLYQSDETKLYHNSLELDKYVQITSPIRRLVDLLNMTIIQNKLGLLSLSSTSSLSINSLLFYDKWVNVTKITEINEISRNIKRVSQTCNLLQQFYNTLSNNTTLNNKPINKEYIVTGYCFDKRENFIHKSGMKYKWNIYIPEFNIFSHIITNSNLVQYQNIKCQIFLFNDEMRFKKKIRVQLV